MSDTRFKNNEDLAKLILRFTVGFLMLFHGVAKLFAGVGFIEGVFSSYGMPSFFAYTVFIGEILAPLMLILGYRVKIASLLIIATMLGVIFMVFSADIFTLTKHGAWSIELQMFYLLGALSIFFQGAGAYSIDKK